MSDKLLLISEPAFLRCPTCGQAFLMWETAASFRSDVPSQYLHLPFDCGMAHRVKQHPSE